MTHVVNMHTKFSANGRLFTILSRNPSFIHKFKYKNLKFKYLTDEVDIGLI